MGKQYLKLKPQLRSKADVPTEKISKLQSLTNQVSLIKNFTLDFGLIILVVSGLGLFIFEIFRFEVILEPIEVPEDIAKQGYTGVVIAEQLTDAALNIERNTKELSSEFAWHKEALNMSDIRTSSRTLDISVPGSPFSIRSIARFIRKEMGLPADYLRGEIVHERKGLTLTLRNLSDPNIAAVTISKKTIGELFPKGGSALVYLTAPSVLAMNAYHKFNNSLSNSIGLEANYNEAVRLFNYCLKHPPATDDSLMHFLWGSALQNMNRPEEAIEQYRNAIVINPNYAEAYNNLGNAFLDLKHPEDAIKQYIKTIDINPNNAEPYNNLGIALLNLKRPEEAIKQYRKAIDINPNVAEPYNNWGVAIQDIKRPDEAIEHYSKAIDINPNYAEAYSNWGNALQELKRPEEAIEFYRKAITINPNNADPYNNLGIALLNLKRPEAAIKQFRKARSINSNDAEACTNWFFALKNLKHPAEATEEHNETCVPHPI